MWKIEQIAGVLKMDGIKLINASEVVTSKKASKVEIKKVSKGPMKVITEDNMKNVANDTSGNGDVARPEIINIVKPDAVAKTDIVSEADIGNIDNRVVRAIKLKEDIYYGPKNANKNKFVRMYKKLGLRWITDVVLNGMMVDGWFNSDKSQYIIKLLEIDGFKRFKFCGCGEIYDYFVGLKGVAFDHNKEDLLSSNYNNNKINNAGGIKDGSTDVIDHNNSVNDVGNANSINSTSSIKDVDENYRFLGADLWSGYRTRQLLKGMPDNWGIIWK